jgi:putative serine protease PepD
VPASFNKGITINQISRQASPGVVDITVTATDNSGNGFFGGQQTRGEGAGVVFDKNGNILTDEHVVAGATSVTVKFPDGRKAGARVVGSDTGADIAVIRVNVPSSELHPLKLADSSSVKVGDPVVAIGSPFGLPGTVTSGIVSAVGRTITSPNQFTIANAIQTDTPINPGNSGGPLLNANGEVIGLSDQIETNNSNATGQASSSGVGFATPINSGVRLAREIIATGSAHSSYVGVSLDPNVTGGAAISTTSQNGNLPIAPGSPAAHAGLRAGDVITAVNGTPVDSVDKFVGTVASYAPGDTVTFTVKRSGQTLAIKVTLGSQPANSASSQGQVP